MQNLFKEVSSLDQRCYNDFHLSEDLLMEHAADGMADFIHNQYDDHESICIVCGAGNNGADGIALARLLHRDFDVSLYLSLGIRSTMTKLQYQRAEAVGVTIVDELQECDVLIDALFGSGFSRRFDEETKELLEAMNNLNADKIACDMPSGLRLDGTMEEESFIADVTLTMGSLKRGMFSDAAKEIVGSIYVIDLGVSRKVYERASNWKLLDLEDLHLPHRFEHNSHKGTYGHLGVICGEKPGASIMTGSAALRFGAGLVTLISNDQEQIPYELMQSHLLPKTTTAIVLGMGLGTEFSNEELLSLLDNELPLLLDADIFAHPLFTTLLTRKHLVITPHPKEFTTVLKACGLADIDVIELQNNRFHYVELFCREYPNVTLLLKGANVIIAQCETFYINPHGTNILAKGGSGDVLAGLIASLMAQGRTTIHAAMHGSLAHTAAAMQFDKNSYALTPNDLIEAITTL
ncbi:MAG: NAD(P)H-hydrate dehydratase [Sulfurimonadaceae bacterium]